MVGCDVEMGVKKVMELVKQSLGKFPVIHVSKAGPELKIIVYDTASASRACMFGWRHTSLLADQTGQCKMNTLMYQQLEMGRH